MQTFSLRHRMYDGERARSWGSVTLYFAWNLLKPRIDITFCIDARQFKWLNVISRSVTWSKRCTASILLYANWISLNAYRGIEDVILSLPRSSKTYPILRDCHPIRRNLARNLILPGDWKTFKMCQKITIKDPF